MSNASRKQRGHDTQNAVRSPQDLLRVDWRAAYPEATDSLPRRLVAHIRADASGCWLWQCRPCRNGYGQIRIGDSRPVAHRVVWRLLVGPIPEGLQLDHLCRVRHCVNPEHLEPVTSRENSLRGDTIPARWAKRTHCSEGHEYTPENTYLRKCGARICVACTLLRQKRNRDRRTAA